ncbi:anaerobic glycerol-3-phosphate dehydrogenase subunit GlpA [Trueperella pyogenes]|uniref:glycerol-3-phosphate dehydrogenase n=1 Tax=Trueperella pyogenes TaxID=1661 RepID=A0ABV3NBD6_9ACTO|nr:anaerobic glycerol-3-phosphate dehydrogenase subunit GlpA [Trueperella pyogenes]AWA44259.1 anaerobic glycerol-3-phosphate dehydrogenase subunit A [Trueperella pyogenes]
MKTINTDVVVIGGGATGAGALRDLAMRGFATILVERADLAQGTSGRFHGLLHSGGRYVISDPHSATECAQENEILRHIHADSVEETGGLFVVGPHDDPEFSTRFLPAARETQVPAEELDVAEALRIEPRLNPGIQRAFRVRDGSIDGWGMVWGAVESAKAYGAQCLTYHRVTKVENADGQVSQVICTDEKTGEEVRINCRAAINCGGPWAGQIAKMAGCHGVDVVPGRGIMIAMNHRLVNHVVNRCIHPADGDIIVPAHTVSIIGTTDQKEDDPDFLVIRNSEVQQMLDSGEDLVPGFRKARAVHAWAGARPLVKDSRVDASDTRHMSRGMSIIDHSHRDGVKGFFTIAGGKLTTYRLMAKNIVDALLEQLGEFVECTTDTEAVPPRAVQTHKVTDRLKEAEADRFDDPIICECELLPRSTIEKELAKQPTANLDDIRRRTRLGMGPCQGTFCGMRAAGIMHETLADRLDREENADRTSSMLRLFVKNRYSGLESLMYGEQLREATLNKWILAGNLDIDHLPAPTEQAVRATGDLELIHGRPAMAQVKEKE